MIGATWAPSPVTTSRASSTALLRIGAALSTTNATVRVEATRSMVVRMAFKSNAAEALPFVPKLRREFLRLEGWEHALDDFCFIGRLGLAARRRIGTREQCMQNGTLLIALDSAAERRNRIVNPVGDEIGDAEIDILLIRKDRLHSSDFAHRLDRGLRIAAPQQCVRKAGLRLRITRV